MQDNQLKISGYKLKDYSDDPENKYYMMNITAQINKETYEQFV